jgi:hypothetical protein
MVHKGAVRLQYVATNEKVVDVLTKSLSRKSLSTSGTSSV